MFLLDHRRAAGLGMAVGLGLPQMGPKLPQSARRPSLGGCSSLRAKQKRRPVVSGSGAVSRETSALLWASLLMCEFSGGVE